MFDPAKHLLDSANVGEPQGSQRQQGLQASAAFWKTTSANARPLAEERLSELKAILADMQRDRDAWRDQAQRLALPKPDEKPLKWWRWLRMTGRFAGAGLLLALSTMPAGAQQQPQPPPQQPECFEIVGPSNLLNIGAILLDKCTGKTWRLAAPATAPAAQFDGVPSKRLIRASLLHLKMQQWRWLRTTG